VGQGAWLPALARSCTYADKHAPSSYVDLRVRWFTDRCTSQFAALTEVSPVVVANQRPDTPYLVHFFGSED